jgi:hypothetical protein
VAGRRNRDEGKIERSVSKWAKERGWLSIKFTPKGDVGWPDRIFISPSGVHVWIEFKALGQKPRAIQEYRGRLLELQGANYGWFDNIKDAINYLEGFT